MSVRTLLRLTFGLLIAALTAQAVVSVLQTRENTAQRVAEDLQIRSYRLADALRRSSDDLTRFARSYAATGDKRFKDHFREVLLIRDGKRARPEGYGGIYWDFVVAGHDPGGSQGRKVALLDLMHEAGFGEEEFKKLEEAKQLSDALVQLENNAMQAMEGTLSAEDGGHGEPDPALARALLNGTAYHEAKSRIMRPIQAFFKLVETRTAAAVDLHHQRARRLGTISVGIAIVAGLLAVTVLLALLRRLVGPVRAVSDRLQRVAETLHATSSEQQVGASEQSAAVEETRQTFTGLVDETRSLGRVGGEVLEHAELAQRNAQVIAERIGELSTSTKSIGEILKLVKHIANRSEVLALNAALEGTKAGEAGRGFSLVATQMQRLAEQVMDSAKKIEALTGEISGTSRNAVLAAEEAEKVSALTTEAARTIAEAVAKQLSGAHQVAVAMDEISQVAEQSVGASRKMVESADGLKALALSLEKTLQGR